MTDTDRDRGSLKDFDAYTDRNGQNLGGDTPLDVGVPSRTQGRLKGDPGGEAETARIASGTPGQDATDATEAETPEENLRRIGDAGSSSQREKTDEAIERATAAVAPDRFGAARRRGIVGASGASRAACDRRRRSGGAGGSRAMGVAVVPRRLDRRSRA